MEGKNVSCSIVEAAEKIINVMEGELLTMEEGELLTLNEKLYILIELIKGCAGRR